MEVVSADGRVVERRSLDLTTALTPQQAYLMTHMREGVVEHGTGRGVRIRGLTGPVAGKTGTTSNYKDAWFAGFTPDLLGLVWVGYDEGEPIPPEEEAVPANPDLAPRLTGAQAALPIWTDFMKGATAGYPVARFEEPPGIVFESIDSKTGRIADRTCPGGVEEAFIEGTEPDLHCGDTDRAPNKLYRWFKDLISSR
jgi:membrane carboxypeptidase/penicillin-binding protein